MLRPTTLQRAAAPARRLVALSPLTTASTTRCLTTFRAPTIKTPPRLSPAMKTKAQSMWAMAEPADPAVLAAQQALAKRLKEEALANPVAPVAEIEKPPYRVFRTASGNLQVYQERKNRLNTFVTEIRKVGGDPMALKADLIELLKLEPKRVTYKNVSGKVVVWGAHKEVICKFLESRGC
ncbi:mitochondrial large subunit ribosomal protein-domain-containing protein [Lasiosphaeria ovina]|uniref:Large ribosomal subunit protein mL49 n=1 Tax=Lasiosphaeria ovina TaxID=92902 RepID=A0AAE0NBB1_9PEZI|nr:mitochondrial large subunit ribosomal protein-domain-containing protein [Lasiosphaeria ovina]